MPQKALLHDPDLVGIAPVSPTRDIRGRKDLDLGSELMVGHKVGLIIAVEIPSDGRRRRLTTQFTIQPLVPYLDTLRWVFIAVALGGIAVTIYARLDDWKRGRR